MVTSQEMAQQTKYSRGEGLSGYMSNEYSQPCREQQSESELFPAPVSFVGNSYMPVLVKQVRYLKHSM